MISGLAFVADMPSTDLPSTPGVGPNTKLEARHEISASILYYTVKVE